MPFSTDTEFWFSDVVEHPHLQDAAVQRLDLISVLVPNRRNFDKFHATVVRDLSMNIPWRRALLTFTQDMKFGRYKKEFRLFAHPKARPGNGSYCSQVGELFSLFQQALHYNR